MTKLTIAFDVDDTLILPPQATGLDRDTPNYETIALYRWFQAQGNYMIIWSGGGEDYARMWGEKLGLNADAYYDKGRSDLAMGKQAPHRPDIAFDDCDVDLAKVNVKVKRLNNSITRPKPTDL